MPDVWTYHPSMLRDALTGAGLRCGLEPRVLKPRDPYWTCHVDSQAWAGDIYIHPAAEIWYHENVVLALAATLIIGLLGGVIIGKWLRRQVVVRNG